MKRWTSPGIGGRFQLPELVAGLAAGLAVLVVSLVQWGMTDAGWTRGLSLGAALGAVVALSAHKARVRAAERERAESERQLQLARELHDAVASQVSIVGIQAAAARSLLSSDRARAGAALHAIEVAARAANADLRRMLATLRSGASTEAPPGLDHISDLVDEYRAHGLDVVMEAGDFAQPVPPGLGAVAYRTVQEALANVLSHAGQVSANVRLSSADGVLHVSIENEPGSGARGHRGSRLGLQGLRERAELFGGSMEAGPRSDGGFVVDVRIPTSA